MAELTRHPEKVALISVDLINGFCYEGPLSSPRTAGIVDAVTGLLNDLKALHVSHFILTQDTHEPDAVEFGQWPPHCICGTHESETIEAFKSLPFFSEFIIFPKNSTDSFLNTDLQAWLDDHSEVETYIVVGDCTDLCIYQMAMHLRLDANARHLQRRVLLPENCVQTYDLGVAAALANGLSPHPGDLMHTFFLYHMALNGIEVVKKLE